MNSLSFSKRMKTVLGAVIALCFASAWIGGLRRNVSDSADVVRSIADKDVRVRGQGNNIFSLNDSTGAHRGYAAAGSGIGYGGKLEAAVITDTVGAITRIKIFNHKETKVFYLRVISSVEFTGAFLQKLYTEPFVLGNDIEAVTGATMSCGAYTDAVRQAVKHIGSRYFNYDEEKTASAPVVLGFAEIILVIMFILGVAARKFGGRKTVYVRYLSLAISFIVLGFMLNRPLTAASFGKIMLGYFPPFSSGMFWYVLAGGTIIIALSTGNNPYCFWMCPFCAAQEGLNMLTGIKKRPCKLTILEKLPEVLAFGVIFVIMLTRNPGLASFEIFSTLFRFIGSNYQFVLLFVVVVCSLFMLRPWCRYVCPVRPIIEVSAKTGRWIRKRLKREKGCV